MDLLLVEAHYAVRNNQRSFLKVTLPPGATIWSASVAGKPVRPGVAEGEAVLLALEKGRAGEEAPTFVVRITYLQAVERVDRQGAARVSNLPALDLPISRTGVELYHSPRFRVALQPGTFRIESDPGVFAEALRATGVSAACRRIQVGGTARRLSDARRRRRLRQRWHGSQERKSGAQFQMLIDRYRNEGGGRTVAGTLPVDVTFPTMGPSLFMASELTAESQAPSIDLPIRRNK